MRNALPPLLEAVFNSLSIEEKPGFPLWESRVSVILILFFLLFFLPPSDLPVNSGFSFPESSPE